ncbi:hypothetical protein [Wolbachia endosymbiont of Tribolium confusum]|uniref:hypothetical protein n=1 Tax=Wolbachia endosymbiont of Tribolium confusum TaxID=214474 RepID=UPI001CF4E3A5|nr:hypothetical protein [Wolbachia endosymbiont of Tribolium confusum]MCA7010646.1 hypothetical protein [Wolbachia endosymbiont of Tribolium confusum]
MAKVSAGENSKKLKNSKNQPMSPKKFKGSQFMSPKRSQNSGEKLWNALESLQEAKSELKKRKFEIELKKDTEISDERIEKVVELERKTEKEIEEIAMPISTLLLKETIIKLQGTKIINFFKKLEKQVKEMQELCNKLELNAKIEEEDLNKLKGIKKESEEYYKELVSYTSNANPTMLYTAVIGVGLAVGLIANTILQHTTRLSMLAIIITATASALVAGGATYATLRPNTKIDESKEVQIKSAHHSLS